MSNIVSLAGITIQLANGYPKCEGGMQTWKYIVTFTNGPPKPGISDFAFQLCNPQHKVLSFSPSEGGEYDENNAQPCLAGEFGATRQMKWNRSNDNVVGEYEFTLLGCFDSADINIAVKAGPGCKYGKIIGPSCTITPPPPNVRGIKYSNLKN
ncbi:MAG: hypothetical protein RSA01_05190 [Clostridium sp.]|uniref:hypothetical protein n=1 Tax=Clostridium sp. TaxID=1506 RepID=UPI002FC6A775